MRKAQRWRYYCDHCKKSGGSGGHMARHERRCTANPNRSCGVCDKGGMSPEPLSKLVEFAKLKAIRHPSMSDDLPDSFVIDKAGLEELRKLADGCPVCMFAALRQSNVFVEDNAFDLKAELRSVWADINVAGDRCNYAY